MSFTLRGGKIVYIKKYLHYTFALTFLFWGIVAVYTQVKNIPFSSSVTLMLFYVLGVIGPAIAGIVVSNKFDTKENFGKYLMSCYRPPKKIKWYVLIVVIVLGSSLLPYFVAGGEQVAPLLNIIVNSPLFILIGGLEEIGWRGFLLRELTKKISPFNSTLIVSVIWTVWHLPLFFIIGTYQHEHLNVFIFIISVVSFSFILSTVYYKTNSIFLCIVTHALYNSVLDVFINDQSFLGETVVLAFSLLVFFAFVYGGKRLLKMESRL